MRKILQFVIMLTTVTTFAQLPKTLIQPTENSTKYDRHIGSIYQSDKNNKASVTDEKSGTYDAKLRYNKYLDALEYIEGESFYKLAEDPTIHANIDGELYYYCNFKNQRGLNRNGYLVLVELQNNYRIYKKYTVKVIDPADGEIDPMTGRAPRGRIKDFSTYFIEVDGVIVELPNSKKEFLAIFSDKETELKNYMKRKKMKLKKEEDIVQLVARYNALKASQTNSSYSLLSNVEKR